MHVVNQWQALILCLTGNQSREDSDYLFEMRQATLSDFFHDVKQGKPGTGNVNFLSIPLPFHQAEDNIVKSVASLLVLNYTY